MCGILGSINCSFDSSVLDLLFHRGPDDSGIAQFASGSHTILLGQRRLSILDLSFAGHQPMISSCGRYAIIFNGEVYNHLKLREKLEGRINFSGHCDTETILYYLMQNGISGVRDFNGIFALSFLDLLENKLYLARDPFGVKPLYYHADENVVIFGSEIRPLRKLIAGCMLDTAALATLLRLRHNPAPETLYKGIEKVLPGHYKTFDLNKSEVIGQTLCYLARQPEKISESFANAVEHYAQKIERAVTRQLLSDVEIGILLSGGLDSAVIAALARKNYSGNIKAFTVGFEEDAFEDEIEHAAETAKFLSIDHYYKKISFTDFLEQIRECTRIVEEPLATTSIIPMYFLAELASKHVKVVLAGQGADEPLGGYRKYKLELLRSKIPSSLRSSFFPIMKLANIRNETILRGSNALRIPTEVERFLIAFEVFERQEIEKLIHVSDSISLKRVRYFYDILEFKDKVTSVEKMMALDTRLNLPDDLLTYTDKLTMHFSMECRVPMLDLELVDYIESLPRQYKLNLIEEKRIHKVYSKTLLPDEIINRKKKGFQSPTRKWFNKNSDVIKDILLQSGTNFSKVFDQSYVSEIIAQHHQGYNKEKQIFLLLTIYYWLEDIESSNIVSPLRDHTYQN